MVFFKKKSIENSNQQKSVENSDALKTESMLDSKLTPEEIATEFLISGLSENLKKLIKRAQKKGVVSRSMIEYASGLDGLSMEETEDALIRISEIGINVKEEYDEGEELSLGSDFAEESVSSAYDDEDDDESEEEANSSESDEVYGVSRAKIENNVALKEFLSSHQDDSDEAKFIESRSSDPVRNYLRAMGTIELFSRVGEIAIAKRIEAGRKLMIEGLCDSPMTVKKILGWYDSLLKEEIQLRDIINLDLMYGDVYMDKDVSEEDLNEDDPDIDDLDDENLDEADLYEDSSQIPVNAMEESLRPTVLETFENIKNGIIKVSCNDAKKLGAVFIQINNEMTNDNLSDAQMQKYTVSTPAKKAVDNFSTNFVSFLENFYGQKNISQSEAVLQAVNMDIYTNIVQTSLMISTGNITEKEFYDYLNIEYCGVTPPASYISPKDIVLYSINNSYSKGAVDNLTDNADK